MIAILEHTRMTLLLLYCDMNCIKQNFVQRRDELMTGRSAMCWPLLMVDRHSHSENVQWYKKWNTSQSRELVVAGDPVYASCQVICIFHIDLYQLVHGVMADDPSYHYILCENICIFHVDLYRSVLQCDCWWPHIILDRFCDRTSQYSMLTCISHYHVSTHSDCWWTLIISYFLSGYIYIPCWFYQLVVNPHSKVQTT